MPPCICSARALQLFIHDFTGLSLRQPRTQRLFRRREFSTRSFLRRLETATPATRLGDDGFIPFRSAGEDGDGSLAGAEMVGDGVKIGTRAGKEEIGKEWQAEVEILGEEQTADTAELDERVVLDDDGASPSSLAMETPMDQIDEAVKTSIAPLGPRMKADTTAKERARLKRKERRVEAGTYKPSAKEGEGAEAIVASALERIKAMEGPGVEERKAKVARPRKASRVSANTAKAVGGEVAASSSKTTNDIPRPKKESWQIQKAALTTKFGTTGWQPRKRLSPDTLEGIRALHQSDPATYSTATLAEHFKITPEAIRRILKSKWRPSEEVVEERRVRWERRGVRKWGEMAELGARPPKRWRELGVKSPRARERQEGKERGAREASGRDDGFVRWADHSR